MELKWDQVPVSDPGPFSKDIFDKFTLGPTIKELWAISQSTDVKEEGAKKPAEPSAEPKPVKSEITTHQTNTKNSHGSVSSCGSPLDCNDPATDNKNDLAEKEGKKGFPDPQVPYPCFSMLNHRERFSYINSLKTKKHHVVSQKIKEKVKKEVTEFMMYLQDVSKVCADDYKHIPQGATRYLEEYFKACLDYMKYYPQLYSIQEITSLSGGKFVSDISLNFEKQLLALGNIDMVDKRQMMADKAQLSVDYDTVSAVIHPSKKARCFYTTISSDMNAEKLSAIYEPHVCIAKEAFIQLLNNSAEAWELPVWVKENARKGSSHSKTVYIDPPLLKTEMTCRERNHLIHEESIKLAYIKTGSKTVFFLSSEDFASKTDFAPEEKSCSRRVVSFDDTSIDFEADVTELESFGESCQASKKAKSHSESEAPELSKTKLDSNKHPRTDITSTPKAIPSTPSTMATDTFQEESAKTDEEDSSVSEDVLSNSSAVEEYSKGHCPPAKRIRHNSMQNSDSIADSDEERLIIDQEGSPLSNTAKKTLGTPLAAENVKDTTTYSLNEQPSDSMVPSSPISPPKSTKKGSKRARETGDFDQLGQILRMQHAMLKSTASKGQETPKSQMPDCKPVEPKVTSHYQTLVKPCVSSYLESNEGQGKDSAAPATISPPSTQKKRLLKEELMASVEDERDYELPGEGNVLYKLYSLLDVLLMVRSTVEIAHSKYEQGKFKAVPVHVLPKLEYQMCYGAESLSHAESSILWAEQLLHSNTASFIGRIHAHTSKVVQLHEVPADWIQNTTCDFKPARCLNTLHHILKKVMSLEEGRYLLGHKPGEAFVTIFKANDGKKPSRSIYDLQAFHGHPPLVPQEAQVPWVPLDPFHLMPFHQKYTRPPCIFPPRPPPRAKQQTKGPKGAKQGNTPTNPRQEIQHSAAVPGQNQKMNKKKKKRKNLKQNKCQNATAEQNNMQTNQKNSE